MTPSRIAAWSPRAMVLFVFYFLANLAGAILIFYFYHRIVQMEPGGYDDGISFMTFYWKVFPILQLYFFINALWGIKALIDVFKRRDFRALIAFGIVFAVWAASLLATRLDA